MSVPVVFTQFDQGSAAWEEIRLGKITASTVGALVTLKTLKPANNETSRGLLFNLLAERVTGEMEEVYISRDMERGTLDEPVAREIYEKHFAPVQQVGFMERDVNGHLFGYSPDGLVGDDGLIEIKSRKPKVQVQTFLTGEVPAANMAQLQAGLLVSGRAWIDYVSFSSGLPLYVQRVYPDPAWQEALTTAFTTAEETLAVMHNTYNNATKDAPMTERVNHFEEMY